MKNIYSILSILLCSAMAMAQPENDDVCSAALIVLNDGPISGNNEDATTEAGEVFPPNGSCITSWCDGNDVENSVWFYFTTPANGAVSITTCLNGNDVDTQIAVWEVGDCADFSTFTLIAATDDMEVDCDLGNEYSSTMNLDGLIPGATYYLQLDGYDESEGDFVIQIDTGVPTAFVNFIHNSADQTISTVDLRINGILMVDNMAFQTCSSYLEIDTSEEVYITVCNAASTNDSAPLCSLTTSLNPVYNYNVVIHGIHAATGYTPMVPLTMEVFEGARINPNSDVLNEILFFHGCTDAPTVDLDALELTGTLVNNCSSGTFAPQGYFEVPQQNLTFELKDENGIPLGINACVPFALFEDNIAVTIITSGFETPSDNSNGAPLGLYLVNPYNGELVQLESGACPVAENDQACSSTHIIVNAPPTFSSNQFATIDANEVSPPNLDLNDPEADCLNAWCDGVLDATVWFNFIAPPSGVAVVTTCFETSFDTQIAIYSATDCNDYETYILHVANDDMEDGCQIGDTYASWLLAEDLTPGNIYYIQLDGWRGEAGDFEIAVSEVVNVDENSKISLNIFPNPAQNILNISGIHKKTNVTLTDVTGNIVWSEILYQSTTLDITNFSPGMYLIRADTEGNSVVKKLVIN